MKISVVIPCYNRADYIQESIDSALQQTWLDREIIVVDDGSTDSSLDILKTYGDSIKLITQPNGGVAAARNRGIAESSGTWIAFLDSDDIWLPAKLAKQAELAARYPESVLIHTKCSTIGQDSKSFGVPPVFEGDRYEPNSLFDLMHHCGPTTSSVMIQKETLDRTGYFDVDFEQNGGFAAEDWELYVRIAEQGPFAYVGEPVVKYRVHTDSKTLSDKLRHTRGLVKLRERIDERSNDWPASLGENLLASALTVHRQQYAHVLGRLGLIYAHNNQWESSASAFNRARHQCPTEMKHHIRYAWSSIRRLVSR